MQCPDSFATFIRTISAFIGNWGGMFWFAIDNEILLLHCWCAAAADSSVSAVALLQAAVPVAAASAAWLAAGGS